MSHNTWSVFKLNSLLYFIMGDWSQPARITVTPRASEGHSSPQPAKVMKHSTASEGHGAVQRQRRSWSSPQTPKVLWKSKLHQIWLHMNYLRRKLTINEHYKTILAISRLRSMKSYDHFLIKLNSIPHRWGPKPAKATVNPTASEGHGEAHSRRRSW